MTATLRCPCGASLELTYPDNLSARQHASNEMVRWHAAHDGHLPAEPRSRIRGGGCRL